MKKKIQQNKNIAWMTSMLNELHSNFFLEHSRSFGLNPYPSLSLQKPI